MALGPPSSRHRTHAARNFWPFAYQRDEHVVQVEQRIIWHKVGLLLAREYFSKSVIGFQFRFDVDGRLDVTRRIKTEILLRPFASNCASPRRVIVATNIAMIALLTAECAKSRCE